MLKSLKTITFATTFLAAGIVHAEDNEKLLTILTAPEPQTQLMAMILTMNVAQNGMESHILLCGPAADIALKEAPETATAPQPPKDMSPQALMKTIMEKTGTTVEVCAIYLPGKGADASILIDGVTAAEPDAMGAMIAEPETKVMSF